jgi:hypothetical protein
MTRVDPHFTIALTPAEFESLGRPGTLYVQITTEKPEEKVDDDQRG